MIKNAVAVCLASGAATAWLAIGFLPSSWALSCALKSSRGRARSAAAMAATPASCLPLLGGTAAGGASRAATMRSNCSLWLGLGMCPTRFAARGAGYFFAQLLHAAKLQLLDGSFGLAQRRGDFPDAFILGETHFDHPALVFGQCSDQCEQARGVLHVFGTRVFADRLRDRFDIAGLAMELAPAVGNRVGSDTHQPRAEGRAAPFEMFQVGQGVMKYLGGDVLGRVAIIQPPRDVGVDPVEMQLVKVAEARRVLLRRFDQPPFGGCTDCVHLALRHIG